MERLPAFTRAANLWMRTAYMVDEVIELKAQLEILQTKIRIKEQRLMDKMNIVKEMELAEEKEGKIPTIPPHQNSNWSKSSLVYPVSSHG